MEWGFNSPLAHEQDNPQGLTVPGVSRIQNKCRTPPPLAHAPRASSLSLTTAPGRLGGPTGDDMWVRHHFRS